MTKELKITFFIVIIIIIIVVIISVLNYFHFHYLFNQLSKPGTNKGHNKNDVCNSFICCKYNFLNIFFFITAPLIQRVPHKYGRFTTRLGLILAIMYKTYCILTLPFFPLLNCINVEQLFEKLFMYIYIFLNNVKENSPTQLF
jgi:small-conductance mechanosensitive channel